jgi:hypothetical protein
MAHNISGFSSIVKRNPAIIKDIGLIKSFVHVLKNLNLTISPSALEYLFKRIVIHIRTYGEIPNVSDTHVIQSLLEDAYNEFYSIITDLTPDQNLLDLIRNNSDVVLDKFVHIITDKTLYDEIFRRWRLASISKGYFSGTYDEFREYTFKFFKLYDIDVPSNPDTLTTGISAKVFIDYFLEPHDTSLHPHNDILVDFMDGLIPTFLIPTSTNDSNSIAIEEPPYQSLLSYEIFNTDILYSNEQDEYQSKLNYIHDEFVRINNITPVIDIHNADQAKVYSSSSFAGITTSADNYRTWHDEEYDETTEIAKPYIFTKQELSNLLLHKPSNYYTDHSIFTIDQTSSEITQAIVGNERADVFEYYYKMINMYRIVPKEFTLHLKCRLNKLYKNKVKDIVNITNYSRSILALYLQPYETNGVKYNRLKLSMDNFNQSMTYTFIDNIIDDDFNEFEVIVRIRKNTTDIFGRVNNILHLASYQNTLRVYDNTPVSMFIGLFLTHFKLKNNVLTYLNIYDSEISDNVIKNLIVGYKE